MKKRMFCLFAIGIIVSLYFISAAHVVTTSGGITSYSVNQGESFHYNLILNNTNLGQSANITQVNITLPSSFRFVGGSDNTNAPHESFIQSGFTLSWSNFTGYLINGGEWKYFEFSANATLAGTYSIIVKTVDSTGGSSSGISVEVTETSICNTNWSCGNWSLCGNGTQTRSCTDDNECDDNSGKPSETRTCFVEAPCVQDWMCTEWSECNPVSQIRSCIDSNLCGNNTGKPVEIRKCEECLEIWTCSDWLPEKCPKDQKQTRSCSDLNDCGTIEEKLPEERSCTLKRNSLLIFIILVVIIITMILIILVFLIDVWKKKSPGNAQNLKPKSKPGLNPTQNPNQNQRRPPSKPL